MEGLTALLKQRSLRPNFDQSTFRYCRSHWLGDLVYTIIGIPFGIQCFKMAQLAIWPFGSKVVLKVDGSISFVFNIFWVLFPGLVTSIIYIVGGVILCITLVGIPWGLQKFKMAKLAFLPFGASIE